MDEGTINEYPRPNIEFLGAKEAYDDITNIMKRTRKEVKPDSMFEDFLSEKAFEIHQVNININI
jgi:hypothetical protein